MGETAAQDDRKALAFEDLSVGQSFVSTAYEMTLPEIQTFAGAYDPQAFHTDPEAARSTFFGMLVASGWHTAAVTMRLFVQATPIAGGLVGAGVGEIAWPRAVRPGDVLRVTATIESIEPSRSRPDIGKVVMRVETFNQRGELVQRMRPTLVVPRSEKRA
ncbi:MaoC family dehydratase [Propylenella binzhouense]|uniref:MaoC family dehydratase n=1 Tax=Propylenella binzhouense TaxID=2555902 RepID=A0A964WSL9_9HYPH|nr:MaoC family dehydratase [Propylenella binzhouense]MYZ47107.1 MaoC family dehydratase [Propylenella binzhouense]